MIQNESARVVWLGQLADREETLTEFDKKYIGLGLPTAHLKQAKTAGMVQLYVIHPHYILYFKHAHVQFKRFLYANMDSAI